jgi:hypothetical protein
VPVTGAPQPAQNFLPGAIVAPHRAHGVPPVTAVCRTDSSGVPHWRQNFLPGGLACPQLLQFMRRHATEEVHSAAFMSFPFVIGLKVGKVHSKPPYHTKWRNVNYSCKELP